MEESGVFRLEIERAFRLFDCLAPDGVGVNQSVERGQPLTWDISKNICESGSSTFDRKLNFLRKIDNACVVRWKSKDDLEVLSYVKG